MLPLSVLTCHLTVGVGIPLIDAVKLAFCPAFTVWLAGCAVNVGTKPMLPLATTIEWLSPAEIFCTFTAMSSGALRELVVPSPSWPS